jgi:hypothetical protein
MTDQQLLKQLGEMLGWEFLETVGALPHPFSALLQALNGESRPIFWICDNPNGMFQCFVAEPGPKAVPWNPLEKEEDRARFLALVESRGGRVSVCDGGIGLTTPNGQNIVYAGNSPRRICEAVVEALSAEPSDEPH